MSDTTKGLREIRDRMDNFRANVASAWVSEELAEMVDEMDRALLEAEEESIDYTPDLYPVDPVSEGRFVLVYADGTKVMVKAKPPVNREWAYGTLNPSKAEEESGADLQGVCDICGCDTRSLVFFRGLEICAGHSIEQALNAAPEPEPEEGEPDKMTDHLMRVAELATHEERIEALENQGHVLFLGSNTLKRIEALEEEMKEERERVWYDIGKIKQRLGIAMQLIRDEAKQAKHVENRVDGLEQAGRTRDTSIRLLIEKVYPDAEPDSEPEPERSKVGEAMMTSRAQIIQTVHDAFHPEGDASLDQCVQAAYEVLRDSGRLRSRPSEEALPGEVMEALRSTIATIREVRTWHSHESRRNGSDLFREIERLVSKYESLRTKEGDDA